MRLPLMQLPLPLIPRIPTHVPSAVAYFVTLVRPTLCTSAPSSLDPGTVRECTATGLGPAMRRPARKQLIGHSRCAIAHCIDHIPANRKSSWSPRARAAANRASLFYKYPHASVSSWRPPPSVGERWPQLHPPRTPTASAPSRMARSQWRSSRVLRPHPQ
jgi:hypothetical protein